MSDVPDVIGRRLIIHGRVQGVGYRAWTVATARRLDLRGWVRNRRDGTVELLAIGPAEAVEALIKQCHSGPSFARVDRVDVAPDDDREPQEFSWIE